MFAAIAALALGLQTVRTAPAPVLIARARAIARQAGDDLWPGFSRVPFPVLLVGEAREVLFCPAGPARGFVPLGRDPATRCALKVRKTRHDPASRATFMAVDGVPTVVIGLPARTDANGAAWVATLLHEHFHQMQMRAPGYWRALAALDLGSADQSGAWMLHYPFPYERADVAAGFAAYARALARALQAEDGAALAHAVRAWRAARRAAFARLDAPQRRYGEFQLWQEGVARYSEIALAEAVAAPAGHRRTAPDFGALALNLRARLLDSLQHFDMAAHRRVSFYALGAGEALLLDRLSSDWRSRYFHSGLSLAPLVYGAPSR